ncbi:putative polysaccharide biosynthesis protein [Clostridium felsineum]|uniref:Stage V sporulation protein B n=1 Tax=Clostridium felsineum TaxID=36839 RepID=A0A1S8LG83_9CLOT|nr:polysaccharide biosynthesis protein [Clostridium felsineum]MCR3760798.1 polysaccharide biosynthesis protein [Clostridium felsineum]URZ03380.1 Stage V sporulation protein B [Clostridium felsineum]URZ08302.1 Stage V sporulation protein B [Clostridium felsineum]URZ13333.1 Stage V sporulation protein B [Clostridium felsineum]URZ14686.1 Stage V sporulation protein B [Clostridium felsineum DSM 794]
MKKQNLIKGTLILGITGIASKILGMFFRWPLIMLIGDEGIGYYQMSYPLYMFFIATASGIPVAISKMVAERNAVNDREGILLVLKKAILLMAIMGGGFTVFLIIFSKQLVHFFNWNEKSYYSLVGISLAPIIISLVSSFRGFFQGMQNMIPTAISQIIEQVGRVLVGVGLAYVLLPKGIEYSAGGAAFGAVFGAGIAGVYLFIKYIRSKSEFKVVKPAKNYKILSELLYIAIPISLGSTVSSIMSLIDSILVPQNLIKAGFTYSEAAKLYGQLTGKAFVLINVPLTLSIALCTSLMPVISEAFVLKRKDELKSKIESALKMSMIIAIPSFVGLFFMSNQVMTIIFPGHSSGSDILKYLSISIPFIVLSQVTTSVLQGVKKYAIPVINLFLACVVKVVINNYLVPIGFLNVYGAIIGTVSGYMVSCVLNIIAVKIVCNFKIKWYDIIMKPAYASVLMIIGVMFLYMNIYTKTMNMILSFGVSVLLGIIVYFIFIFLFGVFDYSRVKSRFKGFR